MSIQKTSPSLISYSIFPYLSLQNQAKCVLVCKKWQACMELTWKQRIRKVLLKTPSKDEISESLPKGGMTKEELEQVLSTRVLDQEGHKKELEQKMAELKLKSLDHLRELVLNYFDVLRPLRKPLAINPAKPPALAAITYAFTRQNKCPIFYELDYLYEYTRRYGVDKEQSKLQELTLRLRNPIPVSQKFCRVQFIYALSCKDQEERNTALSRALYYAWANQDTELAQSIKKEKEKWLPDACEALALVSDRYINQALDLILKLPKEVQAELRSLDEAEGFFLKEAHKEELDIDKALSFFVFKSKLDRLKKLIMEDSEYPEAYKLILYLEQHQDGKGLEDLLSKPDFYKARLARLNIASRT